MTKAIFCVVLAYDKGHFCVVLAYDKGHFCVVLAYDKGHFCVVLAVNTGILLRVYCGTPPPVQYGQVRAWEWSSDRMGGPAKSGTT